MLASNNDLFISLEKSQFKIVYFKSFKKFENIKIDPLINNDELGYVIACAVSPCGEYICVSDDFKRLLLYTKIEDKWVIKRQCILDRRCSSIKFSIDMNNILIADKSGYLLKFPFEFEEIGLNNEENRLKYVALGHISVLTDFDLHPLQKLIATSDRDEKIRLSHYPNCYEIYTFLLGHTKYVTQIAFNNDGRILYSVAADGYFIAWNLYQKTEICRHKYYTGEDNTKTSVVTRMFIDCEKIFLFFKNESYAEIISLNKLNETISVVVDLGIIVADVAFSKSYLGNYFHIISKNESGYHFKRFFYESSREVFDFHSSWEEEIDLGDCSVYARNNFLDTLSKAAVDKTGLDIYFENKEKRIKKGSQIMIDNGDDSE